MIGNSIFCYGNISMTSSHSSRGAWHTVSGGGGGGGEGTYYVSVGIGACRQKGSNFQSLSETGYIPLYKFWDHSGAQI